MTTFTASVTGDIQTNPRFQAWIMEKMQRSVAAGANAVAESHNKVLAGWQRKPGFGQKEISDIGRLLAMREVRVTGPNAWKWIMVNYGDSTTKSGPIVGKYMKFPFQGRGKSYAAATDTLVKGVRLPVGKPSVFFNVKDRSIAPRNMIGTVSKEYRRTIFAAMERAF